MMLCVRQSMVDALRPIAGCVQANNTGCTKRSGFSQLSTDAPLPAGPQHPYWLRDAISNAAHLQLRLCTALAATDALPEGPQHHCVSAELHPFWSCSGCLTLPGLKRSPATLLQRICTPCVHALNAPDALPGGPQQAGRRRRGGRTAGPAHPPAPPGCRHPAQPPEQPPPGAGPRWPQPAYAHWALQQPAGCLVPKHGWGDRALYAPHQTDPASAGRVSTMEAGTGNVSPAHKCVRSIYWATACKCCQGSDCSLLHSAPS